MLPIPISKFLLPAMKDLILFHIDSEDDVEEFGLWAFGKEYKDFHHSSDFQKAWNVYHGKDFLLQDDGVPGQDIPKMVELWKNNI